MKHITSLLIGVLLIVASGSAAAAQTDKRVAAIRAKTVEINKPGKKYSKTTIDVPGISTEGAEAVILRSGKEIKKITATIYGETYKAASEFYFDDGKLIFSYDRVTRYRMPLPLKGPVRVLRVDQIRGYFDGGRMFKLLNGVKNVPEGDQEFAAESERILGTVEAILEAESDPRVAESNDILGLLARSY